MKPRVPMLTAVAAVLLVSGCGGRALNSYTLPGGMATGDDGYTVSAVFDNVENLVPNSVVKWNDVTVGTVGQFSVDKSWNAVVQLHLSKDVVLPTNVTAKVAQKSLLGAEYVELSSPKNSFGRLGAGDLIPLSQTGRYPETEEVLSAVSLLLNGGGLAQLNEITTEMNNAMRGRTQSVHDVISQLEIFLGRLDDQKARIIHAMESLDSLAGTLADEKKTVAYAIDHIEPAMAELNSDRAELTEALEALGQLGVVGTDVIARSRAGLTANLEALRPVLEKLAEAGTDLPNALKLAPTLVFPLRTYQNVFIGDYMNLHANFDITLPVVQDALLGTVPILGTAPLPGRETSESATAPSRSKTSSAPQPKASARPVPTSTSAPGPNSARTSTPAPTTSPTATPCPLLRVLSGGC